MGKYNGPKHRLARREGFNLLEKASPSLERRLTITPGLHGKKGSRRKPSEYGIQLREKQKLKRIYGLMEKQFRNYVFASQKKKTNTEDALLEFLESRLDNIVFRMGFAKTRYQARQLVSHRHILVNGKTLNIPSYLVKEGDVIALDSKMSALLAEEELPGVLPFVKREKTSGKVLRAPARADIATPIDYQLVIEFYSR